MGLSATCDIDTVFLYTAERPYINYETWNILGSFSSSENALIHY